MEYMKKGLVLALCISVSFSLLLVPLAFGFTEEVFEKFFRQDDKFTAGSKEYKIISVIAPYTQAGSSFPGKITISPLKENATNFTLEKAGCKDLEDKYKVCFEEIVNNEVKLSLVKETAKVETGIIGKDSFVGWLNNGEGFALENESFAVTYNVKQNSVKVKSNRTGVILLYGECERKGNYDFCFTDKRLDLKKGYGTLSANREYEIPQVYIEVKKPTVELSFTRSFSSTKLLLGEEFVATVSIKNTGGKAAVNVVYEEEIPPEIIIKKTTEFESNYAIGNKYTKRMLLGAGEEEKFNYTLKVVSPFDGELTARILTGDLQKEVLIDSNTVKISTEHLFDFEGVINKTGIELGEEFLLTVKVENPRPTAMSFTTYVIFPEGIEFSRSKYTVNKLGRVEIKERVEAGEEKEYEIYLKAEAPPTENITVDVTGREIGNIDAPTERYEKQYPVDVNFKKLVHRGKQEGNDFAVYIKNENKNVVFRHITAIVDSENESKSGTLDVVNAYEEKKLVLSNFSHSDPFISVSYFVNNKKLFVEDKKEVVEEAEQPTPKIISEPQPEQTVPEQQPAPEQPAEQIPEQPEQEEKSIITKVIEWFKGLF